MISASADDLTPLLRIEYHTDVFAKAEDYLNSLRAKPLCYQVAAKDLIDSCQSLDQKTNDPTSRDFEHIRAAAKTEFTVRLALCEMHDAQAQIPKPCVNFLPSSKACSSSRQWALRKHQPQQDKALCYPPSDATRVKQCLAELWVGPQSWTSYSNAQQNALLVCQATYEARERDSLIDILTSAARVNGELATANQKAIKRQEAAQRAFDEALTRFEAGVKAQAEQMEAHSMSTVGNIFKAAQTAISEIYRSASEASEPVKNFKDSLAASLKTAVLLKDTVEQMHTETKRSQSEVALAHTAQLHSTQASFEQIMLMIRQSISEELTTVARRMENITDGTYQATLSLEKFNHNLNKSQEFLEQHNAFAQEVFGKVQHLVAAFSVRNIFNGFGTLVGLFGTNYVLKLCLGPASATAFACVFAAVSATHIFGPSHLVSFVGLRDAAITLRYNLSTHYRTLAVVISFTILVTATLKLGVDGIVEFNKASNAATASLPTLATTAPTLYNPASPPYNPSASTSVLYMRRIVVILSVAVTVGVWASV